MSDAEPPVDGPAGHHGHGHGRGHRPPPLEADTEAVGTFVLDALARSGHPRGRLLEVGAGDGTLAAWLGARGVDVHAIDIDPYAVARAAAAGRHVEHADFHTFEPRPGAPFRAVAFTLSLHHIDDLVAAVARAAALVPGGSVILDEFAYERADAAAAAFFFDHRAVLAAAGLGGGDEEFEPVGDALAAWERRYRDEHPIARGSAMLEQLARHCTSVTVQPGPHLARLAAFYLDHDRPHAAAAIARLRALEAARIAAGTLPAIGLRVVGQVAGTEASHA